MGKILESKGYTLEESHSSPEVLVVNTCCVTSRAEGKSRRMISSLSRRYPDARIVATGCLAQLNPDALRSISNNITCIDTASKGRFSKSIDSAIRGEQAYRELKLESLDEIGELDSTIIPGRARAVLKIQDGCHQKCAYCIVPFTRGPSRSMPLQRALDNAGKMEELGVKEITLSGIHIGFYGRDLEEGFCLEDLIEQLLNQSAHTRFRLSSCEPQEISDRLIRLISNNYPKLCRHLHIPVQSGSNRILKAMGRPYTSDLVKALLEKAFASIRDLCVGLDIMVGFPGETDEDFQRTLDLINRYPVAYLHVFPFSPRPGTRAANMEQTTPESIVKERTEFLRNQSNILKRNFYENSIGKVFEAISLGRGGKNAGIVTAITDNYIPLSVPKKENVLMTDFCHVMVQVLGKEEDSEIFGRII